MAEGAPAKTRDRVRELAENVLWMEEKLEDARRIIGKSSVAIPYDNGGGQRGVRKNPAFDGYVQLMGQYSRAMRQLCEMLGTAAPARPKVEPEPDEMDLDALLTGGKPKRKRGSGRR